MWRDSGSHQLMTWAATGIFWKNKRSFTFSGSSWTTASVLERATRSFVSLINFERKYMKAEVKTRTDFWASLCFGENKKKFNSGVPKPQAPRGLYLTGPHPVSSWKKNLNQNQTKTPTLPAPHTPSPNPEDPGKCMTVFLRLTHASSHKARHTTVMEGSA